MKVAMLYKPFDMRLEEREDPTVGPEEVLVENVHTGVCGTDVNHYRGFRGPEVDLAYPVVIGHEFSGVIGKVGEKVQQFRVGDRVQGVYNGSLVQYHVVPSRRLTKLPDTVSLIDAQSIVHIQSTLYAIKRSGLTVGDSVAVLGPGHAGLLLAQWSKNAGAEYVIVTGTRWNRLEVAEKVGADFTVNVREEDPVLRGKTITDGDGVDVVIEATGRPDSVRQAIELVKEDGTVVIFGVAQEPVNGFDAFNIYRKRITMIGIQGLGTEREREIAVKYLDSGRISVKPIITHVLPLEEAKRGFEIVDKRLDNVIRLVIKS